MLSTLKRNYFGVVLCATAFAVWQLTVTTKQTTMHPLIGTQASSFVGKNQDGEAVRLADFQGKKLILYFYPRNNTPLCTRQAKNLRDNHQKLQEKGYEIVGVSTDSPASHKEFIAQHQLPFQLISDKDHSIHKQYGTWTEKYILGIPYWWGTVRTTFVIDREGKIEKVINGVRVADQIQDL